MTSALAPLAITASEMMVPGNNSLTAPRPPPRSPLRQKSSKSVREAAATMDCVDTTAMLAEIRALSGEIGKLSDQIYEIQELRHSSVPNASTTAEGSTPASRLDKLLSDLDTSVTALAPRVKCVQQSSSGYTGDDASSVKERTGDLIEEWEGVVESQRVLREEMKEDGFLVRFRTAAEQAENMMDTLKKSLTDCSSYVDRISNATTPIPLASDDETSVSIRGLSRLASSHESLKKSYVQSISKILKMMDKSISERPTKNGETLRRNADMNQRWIAILKSLQQLDAKIRLIMSQYSEEDLQPQGEVEILLDPSLSDDSQHGDDYFGYNEKTYNGKGLATSQRRQSHSSTSGSSNNSIFGTPTYGTPGQQLLTPDVAVRTLRRVPSTISNASAATARTSVERPRWNPSVKPPIGSVMTTPTNKRYSSINLARNFSPTPSNGSGNSLRSGLDSVLASSTIGTPKTIPRRSLPRNPPSSYRAATPTPSGLRPASRQSLSTAQVAALPLQPFEPSKYDLLDQEVKRILDEVGFTRFVARVDKALQKGQRRGEGEEWKGEYVFGAGERSNSVKLLELAGKGKDGKSRVKVMVRVGGAWQDLGGFLRTKLGS